VKGKLFTGEPNGMYHPARVVDDLVAKTQPKPQRPRLDEYVSQGEALQHAQQRFDSAPIRRRR
jgi:hypothetical protein